MFLTRHLIGLEQGDSPPETIQQEKNITNRESQFQHKEFVWGKRYDSDNHIYQNH